MHRHAFSNGAYPSQGGGTFSIQPHKYVYRRRAQRNYSAPSSHRTSYTFTTPQGLILTYIVSTGFSRGHNLPSDGEGH